jgi:hypothetical protein
MSNFFTQAGTFFKGLFGFVQAAAPVAEEVGAAIGNPAVVSAAKLAELSANAAIAADTAATKAHVVSTAASTSAKS